MQRLLSSIVAVAAGCSNIGNTLNRGSRLYEGSCFKAHGPNNGVYITQVKAHTSGTALVQEYCNSAGQCQVLWASHSGSDLRQGPYNLYMQYDFNVCLYSNAGSAVWCTNTKGKGNVGHLVQQTDSNLVLYNGDNVPKWNSGKHLSAVTQSEEVAISGSCPFANKCVNSHGACAVCNKSPWYDTDHKCVCGTSDADWITADQCSQCSDEALTQSEEVVTSGSCPFANKCVNSHGACAVCNKSPWFDSDHKCVCGTSDADWITADQCSQCSDEALTQSEEVGTSESCPFANKCVNSHGACAVCNKSPWYESDHKCVCGTSDADWITADQCSQCSDEALTQSEILV